MKRYQVRLQYAVYVLAGSSDDAHARVVKMLRDDPEGHIAGIEVAELVHKRSLLSRLFIG